MIRYIKRDILYTREGDGTFKEGSFSYKRMLQEVEEGFAEIIEYEPPPKTPEETRDSALNDLSRNFTYDFGDGRVMQIREEDRKNIDDCIFFLTEDETIGHVGWWMLDGKKHQLSLIELKQAKKAAIAVGLEIWNDYEPEPQA